MAWWQAIILGLVEGLTEYLPVSSTGHLLVAQELMGIGTQSEEAKQIANSYAICIQSGAILAVLMLYWGRITHVFKGCYAVRSCAWRENRGLHLGLQLCVAFFPAAIVGLFLDAKIEQYLFGIEPVIVAWAVGGAGILAVGTWQRRRLKQATSGGAEKPLVSAGTDLESMTYAMAFGIGCIQCVAMWPGTSRSLMTIIGGVILGLNLAAAVEFSFLLGVITLMAASIYKAALPHTNDASGESEIMLLAMGRELGWGMILLGNLVAFGSALVAVKWMVGYLRKRGLALFGWYRIALAAGVAIWWFSRG